jgi:NAD(P)-dependent dehydrogenase (short-subunit alcohol dehydrogenase family)
VFVRADVTDKRDAAALVQTALDRFGRLDGAFNNAGGVVATGPLHELGADAGVAGLTRSAALAHASDALRVNAIVTGNVDTALYRDLVSPPADRERAELPAPNPSGRVAGPEEIAAFVAFLLSDESAFVTGAALAVDGGATA